jgi:cupin fold WbuC family metalloprotein
MTMPTMTMPTLTLIDDNLLDEVCAEAAANPRRRKNHNFHPRDDFPAHRLLNAMQPDSYIPPHRHLDADKDETFVVLRGALGVFIFDDTGAVVQKITVGVKVDAQSTVHNAVQGVDIPHGVWHTAIALLPDTVFLEAKAGPYLPFTAAERAPWAPQENTPDAATYLASLRGLFNA